MENHLGTCERDKKQYDAMAALKGNGHIGHGNKKRDTLERMSPYMALRYTQLLVESSSNVHSHSNCTTYHWVVTDAEESDHLNVCWKRVGVVELPVIHMYTLLDIGSSKECS